MLILWVKNTKVFSTNRLIKYQMGICVKNTKATFNKRNLDLHV